MTLDRIVVVGASLAGMTAVGALRAQGYDGDIIVVGDEDHPPYTRPPLSKGVLAGRVDEHEVMMPCFDDRVELRTPCRAVGLNLRDRTVSLAGGEVVSYDGVVVATGARARTLATAGQHGEHTVRTLDDTRRLRKRLMTANTVLVVGGGYLGMEVASSCVDRGCTVTIVDVVPPLESHLGPHVAGVFAAAARQRGVTLRVFERGVSLVSGAEGIVGVRAGGTVLEADLVITAAGDLPNVEWLRGSQVALGGGALCDAYGRIGPSAVAAGDVAVYPRPDGAARRTPSFSSAVNQGRAAASALLHGEQAGPLRPNEFFWTDAFGISLKAYGSLPISGEPTVVDGGVNDGPVLLAWPAPNDKRSGTAIALNYPIAQPKLRRLADSGEPGQPEERA